MDIYCPKCGEPWDMDSIHDEVDARHERGEEANYAGVRSDFYARGCPALFGATCSETQDKDRADMATMLYDLLGDDLDGAASMFDDIDFLDFDL